MSNLEPTLEKQSTTTNQNCQAELDKSNTEKLQNNLATPETNSSKRDILIKEIKNSLFKNERTRLDRAISQIRQAQDLDNLLATAVTALREELTASRVLIYRFDDDTKGKVIMESLETGWTPAWEETLPSLCFGAETAADYRSQQVVAIADVNQARLTPYQKQLLEKFQVQASLAMPILLKSTYSEANYQLDRVWGLVVVQQCERSRTWQEDEINLCYQLTRELTLALQHTEILQKQKQESQREEALGKVVDKIRNSLELNDIFRTATQEVKQLLKTDRTIVYKFNPDWTGKVVAESVGAGWVSLLVEQEQDEVLSGDRIQLDRCLLRDWSQGEQADIVEPDTFLRQTQGGRYTRGQKFTAVDDIYTKDFPDCYVESLEKYQAKAYLIAPIFQGEKLWGLLGAYQNDGKRDWQESEADLMMQIANQLAVALQQAELVQQIQTRSQELAQRNERETAIIQFSAQLVSRLAGLAQEDTDSQKILEFATKELRQVLQADRVGVFRFDSDWMGEFVVESVGINWPKLVGTELAQVQDTYLKENQGGRYVNRESLSVNDIYEAGHNECHISLLEQWGTKAYAIAPIFQGEQLWGLLGMYQNDSPRKWETFEMAILEQVATQIGVTLQLSEYLTQVRSQEQQLSAAAERERKEKEQLQQGALKVLVALEPSFRGDLTVRAPLSKDEIGTIADGYNTTIQSLREIVRQVQVTAARVNETSSSNTTSVNQLSDKAQQQLDRLEVASQELQQMVTATQAVMNNAQKVEQAVQEANRRVQSGDSLMERTVDGILEMRQTTSETAKKIKKLGEASQKISKVVNLIDNFATQTNLLSLNAAIEATRAGEYGKGFAVVADEVRSLAYQSANATTEIERLVEGIQNEINEVNAAMEVGIAQVVQGSNLVDETRQSLSEIVLSTSQISHLVAGITDATASQNQQSQTLTAAMSDVSAIANQTFESSIQILESFQEMLTTSQELQTSVSQFKVD